MRRIGWEQILDGYGRYRKALRAEDTKRIEILGTGWVAWITLCLWHVKDYFQVVTARNALLHDTSHWIVLENPLTFFGLLLVCISIVAITSESLPLKRPLAWRKWSHLGRAMFFLIIGYISAEGVWWIASLGGYVAVASACVLAYLDLDVRDKRPKSTDISLAPFNNA